MSRKAAPAKNDSDLDIWAVSDYTRKIPLCFEELSIWLARDFQLSFPFRNPVTSDIELFSLQSRYERPTLAYVLRHVKRAVVWFFGCCVDFGEVLFISPIKFPVRRCDPWSVCYKKDSQVWGYRMRLLS